MTDKSLAYNLIYTDLHKTYDSLPLLKLWSAIKKWQIKATYVNAIKNLYIKNVKCKQS